MILRANRRESYSVLLRLMSTTKRANESEGANKKKKKLETISSGVATTLKASQNHPIISPSELIGVRESQKRASINFHRRRVYEKLKLNSYLTVCVDVGQINRAFNLLLKYSSPKQNPMVDVISYNIILRGWAQLGSIGQIVETRMHMIRNNIEPNAESFAYILLGYTKGSSNQKSYAKKLFYEMRGKNIDPRTIFQSGYLNPSERKAIKTMLRAIDPTYDDIFCQEPIDYDCKLLSTINEQPHVEYDFAGSADLQRLEGWAEHQRQVEWKSSISVKSVFETEEPSPQNDRYIKSWQKFHEVWRKGLENAIDESFAVLQTQCATADKIHIYPYLCSVDKSMLIHLMLDEIENNASFASYSLSTNFLHLHLGTKVMLRYLRAKSVNDGSHLEKQKLYNLYLKEYCTNPKLMGSINSREFFQNKALELKNYAIYKNRYCPVEEWPHHIVAAVGKFLYGIILRETKFDPQLVKSPKREIKTENLVHAFYTAYFQVNSTHKIKEEFRAHKDFEKLYLKACGSRLRFDYSFLPLCSPPMPWLSHGFGGYLSNRSELVRVSNPYAEQTAITKQNTNNHKLYPSLDSLNALSLCPWIVNKDILDLVIGLFKSGGDAELSVPIHSSKMELTAPSLKESPTKAEKIYFNREKKRYDQKRREMYSLWCDCHYRLSIANHFRDRIFWFPHNMDFRGRTYPIPPHFNHLGADLARSLLLFAKGQPLGEKGLDWLKIHLINLVGSKKKAPLQERLEYANSILHMEVLDSADNPWDGRRWWTRNENPWQVLACCKEIAKAIRSKDFRQYVSHFPVHQDGSCNGLQHYAALGRDVGGASSVNLVPSDRPQDVYNRVLEIVEDMREKDAENGDKVANMLEGVVQRKVIKQTVMTTVYGVTLYGARHQIARQLAAKDYPDKDIRKAASYLASKTFDSIGKMFNKSRLIQDWLNDCAHIIATRYKRPVSWETPLGFPVVQPYTVPKISTANRLLSSSIGLDQTVYNDPLSKIDTSKQKTAFPPNYIHSLDSSHMMLTSLFCQKQGLTFVSVHDCYWTHPNTVDIMNRICREQFVALHSEPLLRNLADQFIEKFGEISDSTSSDDDSTSYHGERDDKFLSNKIYKPHTQPDSSLLDQQLKKQQPYYNHKIADYSGTPSSSSSNSSYNDRLVEEDLELLLASEKDVIDPGKWSNSSEEEKPSKSISQPLIELYDQSQKTTQKRIRASFNNVPEPGELDLKVILESTYFFS